ncbi:hypothetical protein QQ045_022266 [Rhodiola kirilowii]
MPLHYPCFKKEDYEKMDEMRLKLLLGEYGLKFEGSLDQLREYAIETCLWPDQLLILVLYKKRFTVHGIHFFMLAVVLLKALNLLCEAEDKSYIKKTGSAHGWDVLFYIFSFLKGITASRSSSHTIIVQGFYNSEGDGEGPPPLGSIGEAPPPLGSILC